MGCSLCSSCFSILPSSIMSPHDTRCLQQFQASDTFSTASQVELKGSDGEKCGCKLLEAFEITQPTLSHHMKILCECGLVNDRKEGKWHHYSLNIDVWKQFNDFISLVVKVE